MRKIVSILFFLIPTIVFSQQMNIISFNIRYNTPNDGVNAWPNRKEMATDLLRFHEADIFGLQEALHEQILDVENALPEYGWFGVAEMMVKKEGNFLQFSIGNQLLLLSGTGPTGYRKPLTNQVRDGMQH